MKVAIIMGSDSDLEVMSKGAEVLDQIGVPYTLDIVSAHRTPAKMYDFANGAQENGYHVIIAGAGGAAHLPGMVAAMTTLPVIGVPVKTRFNDGIDSLLSIAQMPRGIPVATVAVNNATNAALLACRIVALGDERVAEAHRAYMENQTKRVHDTSARIAENGWERYLND